MSRPRKIAFALVAALTALDGHAKVNDKCIQTLEARPANEVPTSRPCPMAIAYAPRRSSQDAAPQRLQPTGAAVPRATDRAPHA